MIDMEVDIRHCTVHGQPCNTETHRFGSAFMSSVMIDTEVASRPLLNEEEQQLVNAFRGFGGRPTLFRKVPEIVHMPTVHFLEVMAEHDQSSIPNDTLVAAFSCLVPDRSDSEKYCCEACTTRVPAREQAWKKHTEGVVHKWQMLSLCIEGSFHTSLHRTRV